MSFIFTIFYCWQSDTPQKHCRHLVREALDKAADKISAEIATPYRIQVISDTENEPGLCNIPETILRRLRESDAVVADLTFVASVTGEEPKHCSNPNVLFELGYAFKSIGPERIICVMNEAHGPTAGQIFDLAHHRRPIPFNSPNKKTTRTQTVEELAANLEDAIRGVIKLGHAGRPDGEDEIRHQRQLSEIEAHWQEVSTHRNRGPLTRPTVTISLHPKLFRDKRWPDAQVLEAKIRELAVRSHNRIDLYPPQPTGTAPMNWGSYNDTYGDPWAITYAGQYWTCLDIGGKTVITLSDHDTRVSPEPPASNEMSEDQWISGHFSFARMATVFYFLTSLCREFPNSELVRWSVVASGTDGRWLVWDQYRESYGPAKASGIQRSGEVTVEDFKSNWKEVYKDASKDLCDLFCRDGRIISRDTFGHFCEIYDDFA